MSLEHSPFDILVQIDQASASNESAPVTTSAQQWVGVGFTLGGKRFVTDMAQVGEVLQPMDLTVIPGVQPWVLGVANVRGNLLPVIDLVGFFDLKKPADTRRQRIITVHVGDYYIGLQVDAVAGMRYFLQSDFVESSDEIELVSALQTFVSGGYETKGELWPLFNLHQLLFSEQFQSVAA